MKSSTASKNEHQVHRKGRQKSAGIRAKQRRLSKLVETALSVIPAPDRGTYRGAATRLAWSLNKTGKCTVRQLKELLKQAESPSVLRKMSKPNKVVLSEDQRASMHTVNQVLRAVFQPLSAQERNHHFCELTMAAWRLYREHRLSIENLREEVVTDSLKSAGLTAEAAA